MHTDPSSACVCLCLHRRAANPSVRKEGRESKNKSTRGRSCKISDGLAGFAVVACGGGSGPRYILHGHERSAIWSRSLTSRARHAETCSSRWHSTNRAGDLESERMIAFAACRVSPLPKHAERGRVNNANTHAHARTSADTRRKRREMGRVTQQTHTSRQHTLTDTHIHTHRHMHVYEHWVPR